MIQNRAFKHAYLRNGVFVSAWAISVCGCRMSGPHDSLQHPAAANPPSGTSAQVVAQLAPLRELPDSQPEASRQTVVLLSHSLPEDTRRTDLDQPQRQSPIAATIIPVQEFGLSAAQTAEANDGYTLDQLIITALACNPAIREAEAAVAKATGLRHQVGLRPNPWVGYNGNQLADRATGQHTLMVQQSHISAQKLQRNVGVLNYEVENIRWQAERQRRAVTSDVKQAFYATLGAQQMLVLSKQFVEMADKAVEVSQQRKLAGEGTEVDVLQAEVQLNQVTVTNRQAQANLTGARGTLAAIVGQPELVNISLVGQLPDTPVAYQWDVELTRICGQSPELMAAQTRVARARANLDRQSVQATPNIDWMLGGGYDVGTDSQMINTQVGVPLPINNQNAGNQTAARAEYRRAVHEVQRIEMSLKSRLATAAQNYDAAAASVTLYRTSVIPKAEKMLELAERTFRAGEIDALQVLTIRRTYFDSMVEFMASRTRLAQSGALIEELLLSGSLENSVDTSYDDGLRDQSLSGQ